MSSSPARARKAVFLLIPFGALAGIILAVVNFQLRYAAAVDAADTGDYLLWTVLGGAALGASFACPAGVASFLSADAGKSARFCAAAAALVLAVCWLLYTAVISTGGNGVPLLLPVAAVLTTAAGAGFTGITAKPKVPATGTGTASGDTSSSAG